MWRATDFNTKPWDSAYELLTRGSLAADNAHTPVLAADDPWIAEVEPFVSAYVDASGAEPEFTNLAQPKWCAARDARPMCTS